jgi:SAM-dependent methyltransferase
MSYAYEKIGVGYATTRAPDPRIEAQINAALGDARSVANIGAGGGSYEPRDRVVYAVEPSPTMIRQRPVGSAPAIRGCAEQLPLRDDSVDAVLATLTIHHWQDRELGFAELRRVARKRIVILTWDADVWETFWLIREYDSGMRQMDRKRAVSIPEVVAAFGGCQVLPVPIPHDCTDGFHGAYWRRPTAYLDPAVRAAISTYALMAPEDYMEGIERLAVDLESGAWNARHRELMALDEIDLGYRLVVAEL